MWRSSSRAGTGVSDWGFGQIRWTEVDASLGKGLTEDVGRTARVLF